MSEIKKVVLAYSGGLDTSIIIPWLKENYDNCEVIAVAGNVGQADELEGLEEKALATGASKLYVLDLTEEYVNDYIIPTMQAGAVYEEYLLGTSTARPCIAKGLVDIAKKEHADAIVHSWTSRKRPMAACSVRSVRSAGGTVSPANSSPSDTPSWSHSGWNSDASGSPRPVSHLDTALSVTFSRSASWAWVSPSSRRRSAMNAPIFF